MIRLCAWAKDSLVQMLYDELLKYFEPVAKPQNVDKSKSDDDLDTPMTQAELMDDDDDMDCIDDVELASLLGCRAGTEAAKSNSPGSLPSLGSFETSGTGSSGSRESLHTGLTSDLQDKFVVSELMVGKSPTPATPPRVVAKQKHVEPVVIEDSPACLTPPAKKAKVLDEEKRLRVEYLKSLA